ncbi:cytochrome C assembly family protein [Vibrio genomosp. F10]|uniref:Chromosome partitioning protein ParB n=2 Tax=Vibrio genomosp. F10 TaxID=723171 RepID=A0A1B9QU14_9VIBR|nr:inner membrane protein YpjD [Vibrio genomosp. F10]OCH70078.1 chromosome partitioning protein ParB [Vibrio genomosp. F10]OEE37787.1 chromosome partitioning protein ParB [Vibrio genomosp. F10 str. ZF-129]OEE86212.1 chromosome partitioning protein ParB [Vibrio genomosp. F10 str. 9ZD137]OEE95872.1 chromosome partitioning protein ParB [Vibrio genomosp. F10 str. 9ZC157]OEF04078.1 chromosome partitioning protein ParB [Vibrio genomosp. F10 str. 9ZB36]
MDNLIAVTSAILYALSIATIVPGLVQQTGIRSKTVFISAAGALAFHGLLLSDLILDGGGQNLSILNVASLISFIISLAMSVAMLKTRLWFLLPVVYSFSALNLMAATFLSSAFITHLENDPKLLFHISLALFAYATLSIGALYALQLAWLDHKLKTKNAFAINPNLPPLMMVERQLFKIILIGTLLLTGTLVTGSIFVQDMFIQGKAHKAVLSFIAWVIYSTLLWGHYQKGWRGRKVTWFAVAGATLLTLAYFGSRFVKEIILT